MLYQLLGRTGLTVSRLAFGCGPVSGLLTGDNTELQRVTVARALQLGINWFDTAPGYGQGRSEENLGRILQALQPASPVHIATKVRLQPEDPRDVRTQIRCSVEASLRRLQVSCVTLLQLHNAITARRGDEPFSVTVTDVLGPQGVADVFDELRREGLVQACGLTGTGQAEALREVICSQRLDTLQIPFNLLNPSAGQRLPADFAEQNYGHLLEDCHRLGLGAFAIRVFAGGAVLGQPPSAHTLQTPFFPLALYARDLQQAAQLQAGQSAAAARCRAVRFVLSHPAVQAAIIGFGQPQHVDEAVACLPDQTC